MFFTFNYRTGYSSTSQAPPRSDKQVSIQQTCTGSKSVRYLEEKSEFCLSHTPKLGSEELPVVPVVLGVGGIYNAAKIYFYKVTTLLIIYSI